MRKIIGLIDCNNFFVSCEKVFRPDLNGVPVVVLSSNDGCVISRSYEAKSLGISVASPNYEGMSRIFLQKKLIQMLFISMVICKSIQNFQKKLCHV